MEIKLYKDSYPDGILHVRMIDKNKAVVTMTNIADPHYTYKYEVEATAEELDVIGRFAKAVTSTKWYSQEMTPAKSGELQEGKLNE